MKPLPTPSLAPAWLFLGTEIESGYHSLLKTASHVLWLPPQCREEGSSTARAHILLQKEGLRKEPFPPVATCTMGILELPNQLPKDKQGLRYLSPSREDVSHSDGTEGSLNLRLRKWPQ